MQEGARHRPGQSEDLRVGLKLTKLKAEVHQLRGKHEFLKCSSLACEGTTSATKVLARARNAKALVQVMLLSARATAADALALTLASAGPPAAVGGEHEQPDEVEPADCCTDQAHRDLKRAE